VLPPLDLLSPAPADVVAASTNATAVHDALLQAGVGVKDVQTYLAPQVVIYRVTLHDGVDPKKVERATGAVELALATPVRYAGINAGAVVLEAQRDERQTVHLRDLLAGWEARPGGPKDMDKGAHHGAVLTAPTGTYADGSGKAVMTRIADMPHLLVAGTTGSGKSTFVTSLLTSLMMTCTPDQVRFVLIDPKRVELAPFADSPHLLRDVVQDVGEAIRALDEAAKMMDARYATFAEMGVKDVMGHNMRRRDRKLPRVVVVVDELADLMLTGGKGVEATIVRIAQLGRAAGIHLVLSTQRPDAKTVTGLIRSNVPARVGFMVESHTASKIALNYVGAEKLGGKGDGLFKMPTSDPLFRFQSAFVSAEDTERVVKWWRQQQPDVVVVAPERAPGQKYELGPLQAYRMDDPGVRAAMDAWVPPQLPKHERATAEQIIEASPLTPELIDALAEVLAPRIAAGIIEHMNKEV
jgi:S-DNA-T family DNA segregation ATPase FtsK/SpoIIIE